MESTTTDTQQPKTPSKHSTAHVKTAKQGLMDIISDITKIMGQMPMSDDDPWLAKQYPTRYREVYDKLNEATIRSENAIEIIRDSVLPETDKFNDSWADIDTARIELEKALTEMTKAQLKIDEARAIYEDMENTPNHTIHFGEHSSLTSALKSISDCFESTTNTVQKYRGKNGVLLLDK